ncbi:protein kinase [Coccidioides immitis RS]|uniref:Protein kinase n=3 Tax=Coccidioides immitis TaxID=5501 RepID=A0A0E1RZ12_COCIM|nr:protein kinase [Coccidioides immitis RS]EAS36689.2 protein kinase [Coccidioides immitis RS]KMP02051.1 hypothetical protein CIRG_02190 [Coccidioides immitis RMSCC 2394]KMU88231.1 hypothetical protein CIHG_05401 [Coccidioides immitis H538.4]
MELDIYAWTILTVYGSAGYYATKFYGSTFRPTSLSNSFCKNPHSTPSSTNMILCLSQSELAASSRAQHSRKLQQCTVKIVIESDSTVRKYGSHVGIQMEAETLAFVRKHNSIPVPEIRKSNASGMNRMITWILLMRAPGRRLDNYLLAEDG